MLRLWENLDQPLEELIDSESTARIAALFDSSPSFVAILGGNDHHFLYVNPAYQQLIGERTAVGRTVSQCLPEVAEQGFIELLDQVFASGQPHAARDVPILLQSTANAEPARHWLDFVYQPVRNASGEVRGILVEGSDVSQRHLVTEALHKNEAFYRQVVDAATDHAIIALSSEGQVTLWNRGAEQLLGWTAQEMIGQHLDRIFPDAEGRTAFAGRMDRARRTGHHADEDWRMTRSGRRFWASGEMRIIKDEAGKIDGFVKVLRDRTAEHEASLALQRSEERSRRAQKAGNVGVFTLDVASGWMEPTAEACRIFGLEPSDGLPASAFEDIIVPEDREIASNAQRRGAGDVARDVEYRVRRPSDGAIRIVARRAELEYDAAGKPMRMVGVVQDVTDQRALQTAALESEAQARRDAERVQLALAAGAIIGTWVWDIEADQFTIDEQFAESFGIDPSLGREGIPLEQIIATVHPDDKPGLTQAIEDVVARGGAYAHQYRVRRADGRYYWIEANGRVEQTIEGRTRFPGVLLDIEHRRTLEQDRDAAHRLLATVLEAVPGVVYAKDREGRMLMGNGGTSELLGLPPETFLGRTDLENLEDKAQARAVMANDRRIMDSGEPEQLVEHVALPDGTHAVWLSQKAPLRDEAGQVVGLVGASVNITDRVRAESELRELNQTLEQRIADAVAEREQAEEALRQGQKMEAIGQLTGGIAHDFNNLLSIIMGSVELAIRAVGKAEAPDPRVQKMLGNAMTGANRAAALTQRLLAFSRRQPLAPRPTSLVTLVQGMGDLLERSLGETIRVETALPPDLWTVEVDANQLESALLNLAVNARDAMPAGGVLHIEARNLVMGDEASAPAQGMAPGPWVRIDVRDTGAGMSPEVASRVFEPFFTTKEQGKGTGLGLSMVYGFVTQSGGHVALRSAAGEGTLVSLYLPRLHSETEPDTPPTSQGAPGNPASRGATILVVEDNEGVRHFTVECLMELGYTVLEAEDATSALAIITRPEQPIDLLLTDVIMPGRSGRELADEALRIRPALKVLFMSGYPRDAIVHDGRLDEGVELLAKPFTFEALSARLAAMLPC